MRVDSPKFSMERRDFWKIGPVWVWKWLVLGGILTASIGVIAIVGLPGELFRPPEGEAPAYRYNDPALQELSGVVRVLDEAGTVRYWGEVDGGSFTGSGQVFDSQGELVYDGPLIDGVREGGDAQVYENGVLIYAGEMVQDVYEGEGRRIDWERRVVSEGQFAGGRLEGEGVERSTDGTLLREGTFSGDVLHGAGREYEGGVLVREGSFEKGLLSGEGTVYSGSGVLLYQGELRRGVYHGQGKLYDPDTGALTYAGEFTDGTAGGTGQLYHPSGQLLYTGAVQDGRPRADAFLGLSLAEVEGAFTQHWILYYASDGSAAFVYPTFGLMFWTPGPVKLISPTLANAQAEKERRELLDALSTQGPERGTEGGGQGVYEVSDDAQEPTVDAAEEAQEGPALDMALDPDTDKSGLVIQEVLSYQAPLAGVAQPSGDGPTEVSLSGWREWFSDFGQSGKDSPFQAAKIGPFVYEFPEKTAENTVVVELQSAIQGNVETVTAYREDKEGTWWYQSAMETEKP